jgi:hypothetical protein
MFPHDLEASARPGLSFAWSGCLVPSDDCEVSREWSMISAPDPLPIRRAGTIIAKPMPSRRHYRRPNPDRRRVLELLAASRRGYGKAILRAHGFSVDMLAELVKAGLATTKRERMVADGRQTDVVRVRITDAGRQALAKMSK